MSTFLLPLEICENLASAIAQFWWSSNPPKRGIHWAKWENVCLPKEEGGIGFRLIHEFNLALLAKQLWRLIQYLDSLVARVLKGRYYRMTSPLRAVSSSSHHMCGQASPPHGNYYSWGSDRRFILAMKLGCGRIHGSQRDLLDQLYL